MDEAFAAEVDHSPACLFCSYLLRGEWGCGCFANGLVVHLQLLGSCMFVLFPQVSSLFTCALQTSVDNPFGNPFDEDDDDTWAYGSDEEVLIYCSRLTKLTFTRMLPFLFIALRTSCLPCPLALPCFTGSFISITVAVC